MDLDSALTGKSAEGASATQILRDDHDEIRRLVEKYHAAGSEAGHARRALAEAIAMQAELHTRVEEAVFYPAVARIDPGFVEHAREEHRGRAEQVDALEALDRADAGDESRYFEIAEQLMAALARHMDDEERLLFPKVEREMAGGLQALGIELVRCKEALTGSVEDFENPAT